MATNSGWKPAPRLVAGLTITVLMTLASSACRWSRVKPAPAAADAGVRHESLGRAPLQNLLALQVGEPLLQRRHEVGEHLVADVAGGVPAAQVVDPPLHLADLVSQPLQAWTVLHRGVPPGEAVHLRQGKLGDVVVDVRAAAHQAAAAAAGAVAAVHRSAVLGTGAHRRPAAAADDESGQQALAGRADLGPAGPPLGQVARTASQVLRSRIGSQAAFPTGFPCLEATPATRGLDAMPPRSVGFHRFAPAVGRIPRASRSAAIPRSDSPRSTRRATSRITRASSGRTVMKSAS